MKKIALALMVLLISSPVVQAQEARSTTLKDLALAEMFEYAQALYDRGNLVECGHVLQHILFYDPQYAQALELLRRMGQTPPEPLNCCAPMTLPAEEHIRSNAAGMEPLAPPPVDIDPNDPNADLKREIAAEDQAIQMLDREISQMSPETKDNSHE